MLKISPPNYQFCPFCGKKLKTKNEENKKRKFCSFCNWTYYPHVGAAAAAVIIKNKKVLLVKRKREPYKGTCMFPAGFIDFGEHPEETVKREVKEETGLTVKRVFLWKVIQSTDDPRSPGHFVFFYKVKAGGEILNMDRKENEDIGWFSLNHLPEIKWKTHRYVLREIKTKINKEV